MWLASLCFNKSPGEDLEPGWSEMWDKSMTSLRGKGLGEELTARRSTWWLEFLNKVGKAKKHPSPFSDCLSTGWQYHQSHYWLWGPQEMFCKSKRSIRRTCTGKLDIFASLLIAHEIQKRVSNGVLHCIIGRTTNTAGFHEACMKNELKWPFDLFLCPSASNARLWATSMYILPG